MKRLIVFAAALFAVAGCETVQHGTTTLDPTRSVSIARSQFDDIPVPEGLQIITLGNRSFTYERGVVRVGRLEYSGPVAGDDVVGFYRANMPLQPYGWTLTEEKREDASTSMPFRKGSAKCVLSISLGTRNSTLTIDVTSE